MDERAHDISAPTGQADDKSDSREPLASLREEFKYLIHEIRTPLSAVISGTELAQESDLPPQERRAMLATVLKEAHRINGLLQDCFQVYADNAGTWLGKLESAPICVTELLADAVERFGHLPPGHSLRVELPPDLPRVQGDRLKLGVVLRNLLANAVKYSPEGGEILLGAHQQGGSLVIVVRDQGVGIPEKERERIFIPFFRLPPADQPSTPGAGLGLAMVRQIVENHGGSIRVESKPGRGSTFLVTLPTAG